MLPSRVLPFLVLILGSSYTTMAQGNDAIPTSPASPTDFDRVIISVAEFRPTLRPDLQQLYLTRGLSGLRPPVSFGIEGDFGTGFCVDPECRLIGTNYHVAVRANLRKIKGVEVVRRYLATGPNDEGATLNDVFSRGALRYTLSRDLAIFELRRPIANCHGSHFSLDDLETGQPVDIYAYPLESALPLRKRHLLRFQGVYKGKTATGLLLFDYERSDGRAIRGGASGGLVVDHQTQHIVGVVNALEKDGQAGVLAVPVQSLANFLRKADPYTAQIVFPSSTYISPTSPDRYPEFVPPPHPDTLQRRSAEDADVKNLRAKAQQLADDMRNLIAVQTFEWGSGNKAPAVLAQYEVRIIDGYQHFREYPDGKKELSDSPLPRLNDAITTGDAWAELPEKVGTNLDLNVRRAPDAVLDGQHIRVFQYRADPEDRICQFDSILDFVFFTLHKVSIVSCYGEVWTDEQTNILRMSEHLKLSGRWQDYQSVVTYGWFRLPDESTRLVPSTIYSQAELKKRVYWCRGRFTDYQVFNTTVRIGTSAPAPQVP